MSWDNLIDQEKVKTLIRESLEKNRLPTAYLFSGPEGVGKWLAAIELAKSINCLKMSDQACDACSSCIKIDQLNFVDLYILFPYPQSAAKKKKEEIPERKFYIEEKLKNLYHIVRFEKQVFISIEETREVLSSLALAPLEGKRKIVILYEAEKVKTETATTLLKSIEEPPRNTLFVLITAYPENILPTILSRCQRVNFSILKPELIISYLADRHITKNVEYYARICNGSIGKALELVKGERQKIRDSCLSILDRTFSSDSGQLVSQTEELLANIEQTEKPRLFGYYEALLKDLYLLSQDRDCQDLTNFDKLEELRKLGLNFSNPASIYKAFQKAESLSQDSQRNVNLKLALLDFCFYIKSLSRLEGSGK